MDIETMSVHGWKFQLRNEQLLITSEQDPNVHLDLPAPAALSLLDYLYQYRDDLAAAAQGSTERGEQTGSMTTDSEQPSNQV